MYSRYSATIGTFAFAFQIFVLEPWHRQISKEIEDLKNDCAKNGCVHGSKTVKTKD